MRSRWFSISLAVVVVLAVAFAARRWLYNEPFTKEKWEQATPEMRDRLLLSLARTGVLVGLSEQEVYDMLGEPDGTTGGQIVYHLVDRFVDRFVPSLVLELDGDGFVRAQNLSGMSEGVDEAKFDPEAWRKADRSVRLSMARDLLASRILIGRHRDELPGLLGKPDQNLHDYSAIKIWYTRRYYANGEIKKRSAGASRCLYIHIRQGRVEKAEFVGS